VIRNLRLRLSSKKTHGRIPNPFIPDQIKLHRNVKLPDLPVPLTQHYGQRGEDLIVKSILDSIIFERNLTYENVCYFEIGANHPISTSATFLLYLNGARGVLVEANPKLIPSLSEVRVGDKIINAAVRGTGQGKTKLFVSSADELSTTIKSNLDFWPDFPMEEEIEVDQIEIDGLLKKYYRNQSVSFLSIDCEGPDFEILERIDLERFPFEVIQIEPSNHINPNTTAGISKYLEYKGYRRISITEVNCIFVRISNCKNGFSNDINLDSNQHSSFDIFDTLVTRRFKDPKSLLIDFCTRHSIDFEKRISADNGNRSLEEIYLEAGIPLEFMDLELDEEILNLIPIRRNINRVKLGDTLVSDMYLTEPQLRKLLRKFDLHRQQIYVSNSDKASGKYWGNLAREAYPLLHLGDNKISDYQNAVQVGVRAVLCTDSDFTDFENEIAKHSKSLSFLIRELRLSELDDDSSPIDRISIESNLTLLFAYCEMLCKLNRNLVFLGRDCFQLYEIYKNFFGTCEYLQFSRDITADRNLAKKKLRGVESERPLYVDLISTGLTWSKLDDEFEVIVLIYVNTWTYGTKDVEVTKLDYIFTSATIKFSTALELLNPAREGRLISVNPDTLEPSEFAAHEHRKFEIERLLLASEAAIRKKSFYLEIAGQITDPKSLAKFALDSIWEKDSILRSTFSGQLKSEESHLEDLFERENF
jgi:FkbM family methyltransferase